MASDVPAELQRAIDRSSARFGVPADLLEGIWRVESASTYPNPYRNSLGYGGLFGTKEWDAPTQRQSDYAASILARLLRTNNGDISAALHAYSGGGYTQVPGETTFGNVKAPSPTPLAPNPLDGSQYQTPPRPGGDQQDVGLFGEIGGIAGDVAGGAEGVFKGGLNFLTGGAADVLKAFTAFLWLANPINWLRAFEAFTGFTMMLLGLYYFGKAEGAADVSVRDLLRSPGQLGRGAASGAGGAGRRAASGSLVGRTARTAARTVK